MSCFGYDALLKTGPFVPDGGGAIANQPADEEFTAPRVNCAAMNTHRVAAVGQFPHVSPHHHQRPRIPVL